MWDRLRTKWRDEIEQGGIHLTSERRRENLVESLSCSEFAMAEGDDDGESAQICNSSEQFKMA